MLARSNSSTAAAGPVPAGSPESTHVFPGNNHDNGMLAQLSPTTTVTGISNADKGYESRFNTIGDPTGGRRRRRRPRTSLAPTNAPSIPDHIITQFFAAIESHDAARVRELVHKNRLLTRTRNRSPNYCYDSRIENEAFRCLGAYVGALTGLQLAILLGNQEIALDIIDATFQNDLGLMYGLNNTTLHLAAFLDEVEVVRALIERGIDMGVRNGKGYLARDLASDPRTLEMFCEHGLSQIPEESGEE